MGSFSVAIFSSFKSEGGLDFHISFHVMRRQGMDIRQRLANHVRHQETHQKTLLFSSFQSRSTRETARGRGEGVQSQNRSAIQVSQVLFPTAWQVRSADRRQFFTDYIYRWLRSGSCDSAKQVCALWGMCVNACEGKTRLCLLCGHFELLMVFTLCGA